MSVGVLALLHLHFTLSFHQNCLTNLMEYKLKTLKSDFKHLGVNDWFS